MKFMRRTAGYTKWDHQRNEDLLEQGSSTFLVRGPIYIFHIILRAAVIADYKIIMDILNIIIGAWAARQMT